MRFRAIWLMAFMLIIPALAEARAEQLLPDGVDPSTGFRMERYKAPVPDFIPGGTVLSVAALQSAITSPSPPVLVDVYPPRGAGPDPLDGNWRITEDRANIEGSIWLPDVGRGFLEKDLEAYFERNLDRITGSDKTRSLVFYCTADCWQGWNAARRAILLGYSAVSWFPLGTDGWQDEGLPVVPAQPVNFLEE